MKALVVALFIVMAATGAAEANWRLYHKDNAVVASFDYLSRASLNGRPAVWVRWHYVAPRGGVGGEKLLFTADCTAHKLYEVKALTYDTGGTYLPKRKRTPPTPQEYSLPPGSLNEATYRLLCH